LDGDAKALKIKITGEAEGQRAMMPGIVISGTIDQRKSSNLGC
jgi:hypothetical protein